MRYTPKKKNRAIVLIEVLAALLILGLGITSSLNAFRHIVEVSKRTREYWEGHFVASNTLFDLFALPASSYDSVVTGADEEYPGVLPNLMNELGPGKVYIVAGYPEDYFDELKKCGVGFFIHRKSNVFETLRAIQETLGME